MIPVDFPGANVLLTKPHNMTDEECSSLPAYKGIDEKGYPYYMVAIQPNKEDIEAIVKGRPIIVKVMSDIFAPMALITLDDDGEVN